MQRKCQTMKNILMVLFKHDILKNVVSKKYRDKMFTVILPYDTKYSAINIQGFCLIYIQCFCPRIMILVYKSSVQKYSGILFENRSRWTLSKKRNMWRNKHINWKYLKIEMTYCSRITKCNGFVWEWKYAVIFSYCISWWDFGREDDMSRLNIAWLHFIPFYLQFNAKSGRSWWEKYTPG